MLWPHSAAIGSAHILTPPALRCGRTGTRAPPPLLQLLLPAPLTMWSFILESSFCVLAACGRHASSQLLLSACLCLLTAATARACPFLGRSSPGLPASATRTTTGCGCCSSGSALPCPCASPSMYGPPGDPCCRATRASRKLAEHTAGQFGTFPLLWLAASPVDGCLSCRWLPHMQGSSRAQHKAPLLAFEPSVPRPS